MPRPSDFYPKFQVPTNPEKPLTRFQHSLILSAFPDSRRILLAEPARSWAFYPLRVRVGTADGERTVFLRKDVKIGGVELEAKLLPVLLKLGLPVPKLLAGPAVDPESEDLTPVTVISAVPGQDLLDFSWEAKGGDVYIAMQLVLDAVSRLHGLTSSLQQEAVASMIPNKTLLGELDGIHTRGGAWLDVAEFREALTQLEKRIPAIEAPLVFSNGDYNPGNFLFSIPGDAPEEADDHSMGNPGSLAHIPHKVTGFVDFSWACFEDPHIGFAKYWTYAWFPAGMVERYLYVNNLTSKEFAPRLALRCLWTLQRESMPPAIDPSPSWHRDNLMGLLRDSMAAF